jgi:hypothetical protein
MQAVFRTMFRAAAQGDTKAGRQILDVIARAESGRAGLASKILQHAVRYKQHYLPVFEKHEREGPRPVGYLPHPDDLVIDETTGEVTIDGPTSEEQAGARKAVRERALGSMLRYFEVKDALSKDPTNRELKREFKSPKMLHDFLHEDAERNLQKSVVGSAAASKWIRIISMSSCGDTRQQRARARSSSKRTNPSQPLRPAGTMAKMANANSRYGWRLYSAPRIGRRRQALRRRRLPVPTVIRTAPVGPVRAMNGHRRHAIHRQSVVSFR